MVAAASLSEGRPLKHSSAGGSHCPRQWRGLCLLTPVTGIPVWWREASGQPHLLYLSISQNIGV